jgi:L-threonylcarbamoyladenylate synthase
MKTINDFDNKLIIKILNSGGTVIFPCETVYGIAVDSQNQEAVVKLNNYKQRPLGKPYAIMCSSQKMAQSYVYLNKTAKDLYKKFLPGPLTVISKSKHKLAEGIESETGTLGIRIPDYLKLLKLIKEFGRPIVATSANASYQKRPYKISDIFKNISDKQKKLIDLIIDVGELPKNEPSTVIDTTLDDEAVILRQGDLKLKDKNEVLSRNEENTQNIAKELWQKYQEFAGKRAIIFALEGQMGAGKTQFVKGLAKTMGIREEITSPSYDLLSDYRLQTADYRLIHIDTWRMLKASEETKSLKFERLIGDKSVIAIEWADRVSELIRSYSEDAIIVWVKISYGKSETERLIIWGNL